MWNLAPHSSLQAPLKASPRAFGSESARKKPVPRRTTATNASLDGDGRFDDDDNSVDPAPLLTFADVQRDAEERGMELKLKAIGPWWELTLEDKEGRGRGEESSSSSSSSSSPRLLARAVGVTALGICHLDSLVVSTRRTRGEEGLRVRGSGFAGTGGLMAQAVFSSAFERAKATTVEVLAVDDGVGSEHDRLVKAYGRVAGFRAVARVEGDKVADVPHMLVWGAAGTRMDSEVAGQLRRWGAARRKRTREGNGLQKEKKR